MVFEKKYYACGGKGPVFKKGLNFLKGKYFVSKIVDLSVFAYVWSV